MVLASLGTIGAVVSNPQIVQQGATLIGLNNDDIVEKNDINSEEDILKQFLETNHNETKPNTNPTTPDYSNTSAPPSIATSPFPVFPATPDVVNPISTLPDNAASNNTPITPTTPTPPTTPILPYISPTINTNTPTENPEPISSLTESTAIAPVSPATASPALATNIFPQENTTTPNHTPTITHQINIPPANVFPLQETPPTTTPINTEKIISQQEIDANKKNPPPTQENLANLEQWSEPTPFAVIPSSAITSTNNPTDYISPQTQLTNLNNPNPNLPSNSSPSGVLPDNATVAHNINVLGQEQPNPNEIFGNQNNNTLPTNATQNINDFAPIYDGTIFPNTNPAIVDAAKNNVTPAAMGTAATFPSNNVPAASVPPQHHHGSTLPITPNVIAEEVPCIGTETVARVGCEVILMCDILPQLRRFGYRMLRENINSLPPEKRQLVTEEEKNAVLAKCIEVNYPEFLKMQIEGSLVYNDFLMMMPREQISAYEKRLHEEFDRNEIPAMIKEFGVSNYIELKKFLQEKLGSSIERERMLSTRNKIIQMWVARSVQDSDADSTYEELREYYKQHLETFTTKERVRWKEMVVLYSSFKNKQEALNKINWLLGEVQRGVDFEGLAKLNSDGLTAPKGGVRDWTKKGDISSKIIENAIFEMPTNQLKIIEAEKGYHIVLITDHEQENVVPFIDAQTNIRRKIKMERLQKKHLEFFEGLKQKYRVIVLRKDFNQNMTSSINNPLH
jgi:hypothetical protein